MDNFKIDIVSEGELLLPMKIAFGDKQKATHYVVRGNPTRMVFLWAKDETWGDSIAFPFRMDAEQAAGFASDWLDQVQYPKEPDHDGDNGKGWRVYCEGWGHVDSSPYAFVAVSPVWAMYGK